MVVLLRFFTQNLSLLKNRLPEENRRSKTNGYFESTELTGESDRDDIILIT